MKRVLAAAGVCVVVFASLLSAQAKPNFAGKWTLVPDANSQGGGMMTAAEMTVAQDDKTVTVTTTGQMGEIKTLYSLDGKETKSPIEFNGNSIDRTTKTAWDGNKLVLTTVANFNGQGFETKQVWSLNADGSLAVDSTRPDFQGGGAPVTTKLTYKKS